MIDLRGNRVKGSMVKKIVKCLLLALILVVSTGSGRFIFQLKLMENFK